MKTIYGSNLIKFLVLLLTGSVFISCGKISNIVDVEFSRTTANKLQTGPPFLGLSTAANTQVSGAYRLEGNIGNQLPTLVKTSGAYTFYGGIQGEIISR